MFIKNDSHYQMTFHVEELHQNVLMVADNIVEEGAQKLRDA
jgi:hypothetical protein